MIKIEMRSNLTNPRDQDIAWAFLSRILRQAGIPREDRLDG